MPREARWIALITSRPWVSFDRQAVAPNESIWLHSAAVGRLASTTRRVSGCAWWSSKTSAGVRSEPKLRTNTCGLVLADRAARPPTGGTPSATSERLASSAISCVSPIATRSSNLPSATVTGWAMAVRDYRGRRRGRQVTPWPTRRSPAAGEAGSRRRAHDVRTTCKGGLGYALPREPASHRPVFSLTGLLASISWKWRSPAVTGRSRSGWSGCSADRGAEVRALIRNPEHSADVRAAGAEPVECDLEADFDVAPLIAGVDAVVFAAGAGPGSGADRKWSRRPRRRDQADRGLQGGAASTAT